MAKATKPIVALVGRTNVGKSTLFNLLARQRLSVVGDVPHITRDRVFAEVRHEDKEFILVDTGGMGESPGDPLRQQVQMQAQFAVEEADLLVMVVDGKEGLVSTDYRVADILRRATKPIILVANKMESEKLSEEDFYDLRLGVPLRISAKARLNIGLLLEQIGSSIDHYAGEPEVEEDTVRVAIVGHPNVGKSSLVNTLLGQERMLVNEIPGTTRDAVDSELKVNGRKLILIDTAGIRRQKKIKSAVEYYSTIRSFRAIDRGEVALAVFDASEGITAQDQRIAGYAHNAGRASVCVINKWDLVEGQERAVRYSRARADFRRSIRSRLAFLNYAPVVFCSALTGQGVEELIPLVFKLIAEHRRRVETAELNRALNSAITKKPPPLSGTRQVKIYYGAQVGVAPPTFVIFVNDPKLLHFSYRRYLINTFRKALGFEHCPLRLITRKSEGKSELK